MNDTPNQTTSKPRLLWRVLVPAVTMLGLSAVVILYGNRVYDYFAARAFTPSGDVKAIHDAIGLTGQGTDVFYASRPAIQTGSEFNQSCSSTERTAAILGCYYKRAIYIYDVTNSQLAQAKDVTAAHELLHGAYERLNYFDRQQVDSLINAEYAKLQDNKELKKVMAYYENAEPGALTNELHSLIGTTVADISPDLERYYARYFTDRQKIVSMNTAYNSVFAAAEQRAEELNNTLTTLKPALTADSEQYARDLAQLELDIAAFNERAKSGYYSTTRAFNAARQALLDRVTALNAMRDSINARVAEYNNYLDELKQLSVKVDQLNSSINGIASPGVSL